MADLATIASELNTYLTASGKNSPDKNFYVHIRNQADGYALALSFSNHSIESYSHVMEGDITPSAAELYLELPGDIFAKLLTNEIDPLHAATNPDIVVKGDASLAVLAHKILTA